MRRSFALASVLLACGLTASSCGGDSESDGTSTGGKGGTGNGGSGGSGGTSATGGSGNTGGGTAGAAGTAGGGGGISDGGTQCGSMTCASNQACCPGLEYCYPATCNNCCPSVMDGGGGSGGGGTGGGSSDGGPQQCGFQTCGPNQSCCSLGSVQYCYQTSCTFCCQGGFDGGFGGFGGGADSGFGGFGNFGGFGGGTDSGFGGFGNFGGFGGGTDASFGGFGNFGGGPPGDGGTACGAMACSNGFTCCKNQYCYPSACLACCPP